MRKARWIGAGLAVAVATAAAFLPVHQFVRKLGERIGWSRSSNTPHQSELLSEVFKSVADPDPPYQPVRKGELQFHKQIAPIVYDKCARCHNAGGVAPFQLTSFGEVRKRARRIEQVVNRRIMPPWMPDRCSPRFEADPSLTNQEKGMLQQWLAEGCREGDRTTALPPPRPLPEWPNGTPDAIVQPLEAYKVPAEGPDVYRCFVIPTNYNEGRYIRLTDVAPGCMKAVHHVLLYTDNSGAARAHDAADPGPGFAAFGFLGFNPTSELGQWEPGVRQQPLPDGVGYFLPKGADVVIQVHYHPTGKEETDLSRIAIYFCDKPVDARLRCMPIVVPPKLLSIGANDSNAVFWAEQEMPGDVTIRQVFPHMHLLGREIAAAAILPDNSTVPIIRISNWDFRWQNVFMLKNPIRLPKGTRVRVEARYDNSAANPRNPNQPPKFVRFGLRTVDEMCLFSLMYTVDSEKLTQGQRAGPGYPDSLFRVHWGKLAAGRKPKRG